MLNCHVSIIGPPFATTVLELFFLDDDGFASYQRVDYVRVMGCALVCKHSIRPGKWSVNEHCVCCAISSSSQEPYNVHPLDDTAHLLGSIELYGSHSHLRNIVFLLMAALIIDGNLDLGEHSLYLRVYMAARLQKLFSDVLKLKDDFVAGKGIHMDTIYALIATEETEAQASAGGTGKGKQRSVDTAALGTGTASRSAALAGD